MLNSPTSKLYAIYFTITLGILIILSISPIPQDPTYHDFADQRQLFGIANFWNVISNMPFIIISFIAVMHLLDGESLKYPVSLHNSYLIFFISIGTVGLGSAYYHSQPNNETLLWDRLPMTVGFMAFMAIIVGEYISEKVATKLLLPLIFIGVASVFYWHFTEMAGNGDLRPYGLIQFLPMLIIPMILFLFPARYSHSSYFWALLATYFFAKIFETFDLSLFNLLGLSGHTLKHFCATVGPYLVFLLLKKRC